MISTIIPQLENVSLFEILKRQGIDGCDICDMDWDWGTYLGCGMSWKECHDAYDRCMLLFALNIKCKNFNENGYSGCYVAEFISNNITVFRQFFNDENRQGYRPMDYENADDPNSDDGFFEAYLAGFESLIVGNYGESDYEKLFNLLTTKEQRDIILKK